MYIVEEPIIGNRLYNKNMEIVQALIKEHNPKRIYDIGCGTGNLTGVLSSNFEVIGIDRSDEMLSQLKLKHPNVETVNTDINEWISNQSFEMNDLIVSSFVLHAVDDKSVILDGLSKALSNRAHVILLDYVFDSVESEALFIQKLRDKDKRELAELVEKKHYMKLDEINKWCSSRDISMKVKMLTHWIGIIELNK